MPDAVDKALHALVAAWGEEYPEIFHVGGTGWAAYHKDAGDLEAIEADTPGELDAKIRADWHSRQGARPDPRSVAAKYLY